jgi:hypothetical protein
VSYDAFCEWKDTKDLLKNGSLKLSELYRAFSSVGGDKAKELNFEQFNRVLDIIGEKLDVSDFDEDVLSTVDGEELQSFKDREVKQNANKKKDDDDDDDEEERKGVREIFDGLTGPGRKTLPLIEFVRWEDVQELLSLKALSQEKLALAITNVDASEKSELSFDQFYDLLQLIDSDIDRSKLPDDYDEDDDDEDDEAATSMNSDSTDEESMEEIDLNNEEYVQDMFKELSKGKDFIPENVLRKSDDIQDMISEGKHSFAMQSCFG